jgi:hypothetical protein
MWLVPALAIGLVAAGLSVAAGEPVAYAQPAPDSGCVVVVPTTTTPPVPAPVTTTESAVAPMPCPPATATTEESASIEPTLAAPPAPPASTSPVVTTEATEVAETTETTETTGTTGTTGTTELAEAAEAKEAASTTTTPAETTSSVETTTPVETIAVDAEGLDATETTSAVAETTDTVPTTTIATEAPTTSATDDPPAEAAMSNLLDIVVPSSLIGPSTVTPGTTWTGNMSMTVLGVGVAGWTSSVSLSDLRGVNTGQVLTPTSASYLAPSSACTAGLAGSSPSTNVALTTQAKQAKRGGALCLTGWTATVSIGIPATDVVSDTYTATLTHSIF